ncbi:hypothetical protein ABTD32_19750, partial [Acinetobacter baumannii]
SAAILSPPINPAFQSQPYHHNIVYQHHRQIQQQQQQQQPQLIESAPPLPLLGPSTVSSMISGTYIAPVSQLQPNTATTQNQLSNP